MNEGAIDEENPIIAKFEIQANENTKLFVTNKCPINLKGNKYIKLKYHFGGRKSSSNIFESSQIDKLFNINPFAIIFMMFYSITLYDLLITFIIYHDIRLLIYFIIIYILGSLFQVIVIPKPIKFKSKKEFDEDLNQILNSYIIFEVSNNKKKKKAIYQAKYTIDITGSINIPKDFCYAKIKEVQLFARDDLNKLVKNFGTLYKSTDVNYKMIYRTEETKFDSSLIYSLDSENDLYSINKYTTIFSIFLLQWINAIYYWLSKSKKCINIYLAKLITNELANTPTNFTIHGKRYQIEPYLVNPIETNSEFDKDFEEYERDKKEKEEREARLREEKERNTEILSEFENGRNFTIIVKRVYNTVYLKFDAYTSKGHSWHKSELGDYDPNIEERIVRKDKMTIYYPKGFDIRIEVLRDIYSYTITIGDDYTRNFEYYHN